MTEDPIMKRRRTGWDQPARNPNSILLAAQPVTPLSNRLGDLGAKNVDVQKVLASFKPVHNFTLVDPNEALKCRIYVGSLYYDLTEADVRALFESFGEVVKCEMSIEPLTQRSKGYCFIEFRTPEMADAAMAMNGFEIAGRRIKVGRPLSGAGGVPLNTKPAPVVNPSLNAFISEQSKSTSSAVEAQVQEAPVEANGSPVLSNTQEKPVDNTSMPKRTVILTNMVSVEEARTDPDLKDEIEEEAANYGKLSCPITIDIGSEESVEGVTITLKYVNEDDASKAFLVMNGRIFGGRTIKAVLA